MRERDYQFDNLKGMLIFLVVFGHLIEYMVFKTNDRLVSFVYSAIYLFHMPLFVFISGYFSKTLKPKRILELFMVYLLWQMVIVPTFLFVFTPESFDSAFLSVFAPQKTYWYLLSLMIWKIVTPTFAQIKWVVPLSIVAGILVGYSELSSMTNFSYARTVAFYPFFLVGFLLTKEQLQLFREKVSKYWGAFAFTFVIIVGIFFLNNLFAEGIIKEARLLNKSLFMRELFATYLVNPYDGIWIRPLVYLIGFIASLSTFAFVSTKKTFFATWGQNSFLIFVSHAMILQFLNLHFFRNVEKFDSIPVLVFSGIAAVLYCTFLSWKPIAKLGSYFVSPSIDFLLKDDKQTNKEANRQQKAV